MAKAIPYLKFDNSLEAIEFYKHIFGDKILVSRIPLTEEYAKSFNMEASEDKTLHGTFNFGGSLIMFSDSFGDRHNATGAILLDFNEDDKAGIDKMNQIYENAEKSPDCKVVMPLLKREWGGSMGIFVDKYDVTWMLHSQSWNKAKKENEVYSKYYNN